MIHQWKSIEIYEHPAKHQAGTYGNIVLSTAGVYCMQVGGSTMSCPQDWAAAIHAEETGQTGSMIVRKIPDQVRREFKAKCASKGISQQDCIINLMREYIKKKK